METCFGSIEENTEIKTIGGESILGSGNIEFKTINGNSILGSGNITIEGSGSEGGDEGGEGGDDTEPRELTTDQRIDVISDSIDMESSQREESDRQLSNRLAEVEIQTQNLGNLANCNFQVMTQDQYDALGEPDSHTFYFIVEEETDGDDEEEPEENENI